MTVTTARHATPPGNRDDTTPRRNGSTAEPLSDMNTRQTRGKQLDIQGLRMVAVVAVVVNHLTDRPVGGFVGVDVFFVISGFLITGHLVRDTDRSGGIASYLGGFYARRVRRLLPAALVTTAAVWVASKSIFIGARAHEISVDAIWSTLFVANWRFIATGTDYFAAGGKESPLQHYWSLSVEEQFYVVWPLLLFGALMWRRSTRSARSRANAVLVVVAVVCVASFAWAWASSGANPVEAYFSTWTRAWELGLGAALAVLIPRWRLSRRSAIALSWSGLILIGIALFTVRSGPGFPGPGALLPCVGALLVLASTASGTARVNPLLTNAPAVAIGDASYAIYLVHFPVIVFMPSIVPTASPYYYAATIFLVIGASLVLHWGVEKPVLASNWLRFPRRAPGSARPRLFRWEPLGAGVGIVLVALTVPSLWSGDSEAITQKYSAINDALIRDSVASSGSDGTVGKTLQPAETALQAGIRKALVSTTWPTLDPGVAAESERDPVPAGLLACGDIVLRSASECTFGAKNAPNTLYVIGDSTSMAYVAAYRRIVEADGNWKMRVAGAYGCSTASIPLANPDSDDVAQCAAHNDAVIAEINAVHPTLVLVTNTYAPRQDARTGATLSDSAWVATLSDVLDRISAPTKVALVEPTPTGVDAVDCYDPRASPTACVTQIPAAHRSRAAAETQVAQQHTWSYVRTDIWFCDLGTGYCPAYVDTTLVKHDTVHVSYAYDDKIADVMLETLRRNGLLPS